MTTSNSSSALTNTSRRFHVIKVTAEDAALYCKLLRLPLGAASAKEEHLCHQEAGWDKLDGLDSTTTTAAAS